jgi:alkylhydroperoxidase family enzyme
MEQRTNIAEMFPSSYKAMYDLSIAVNKSSLTPVQKVLIKISASQINGCAFIQKIWKGKIVVGKYSLSESCSLFKI